MTFLYPLGLLGLIGIPILIVVYLIKNRYTEQTIASTYLWQLSERFLKRRNPLSRLTGIIGLILQLLLVATVSLAVAHPIITLPGTAYEYCFILDGSASMNMTADGVTRFDLAKQEILDIASDAKNGSKFTVVLVGEATEILLEKTDDVSRVADRLEVLSASGCTVSYTEAIGIAQGYFDENPATLTYLVTDTDYAEAENISLINVARTENNISIEDVKYVTSGKSTVIVSGRAVSYGADRTVDIEVLSSASDTILEQTKLQAFKDEPTEFTFTLDLADFYSITVRTTTEDAYAADNVAVVYNLESENSYNALLVSDAPFLIDTAIDAVSNADVAVISIDDYKAEEERLAAKDKTVSGYSLYVFDGYTPKALPKDGSVWFLGVDANVEGSGFSIQGEVQMDIGGGKIALTNSTTSTVRKLTKGMVGDEIVISKYMKCGLYSDFTTLFSYKGNPIIFTGMNDYGNREVVFAFNIHDSNMPLCIDYLVLLGNLLDYSFPEVIETTEYYCGDTAEINVISGCESIRVQSPDGQIIYTDISSAVSDFVLSEVGEYKVMVNISGTDRPAYYIYSSVPKEERVTESSAEYIGLVGEPSEKGSDGRYDPMTLLFILAALIFTAEWMVYCYDKYQIR